MIKEFGLPILFDISTTKSVDKNKLNFVDNGEYDFIGRTSVDWGIQGKLHKLSFEPNPKDSFSLIQVGETVALWREKEWYASQNLFLLNPKIDEIKENKLYFQCAINKEMSRYGKEYNSYPTMKSLAATKILLPVIENPNPDHEYTVNDIDWQYMQECIAELEQERVAELDAYLVASGLDDYELTDEDKNILSLSPESASDEAGASEADFGNGQAVFRHSRSATRSTMQMFKKFKADELFEIKKGTRLTKADMEAGDINFIGSTSSNNGVTAKIGNTEHLHPAHTITVSYNGSVGEVFLQDEPFWASDDVNVWYPKIKVDERALLYIMTLIKKLSAKYSYTAKWTIDKMRAEQLSLPIIKSPDPDHEYTVEDIDFKYMERYIRATEKLAIADVVKYKDKLIETTRQIVGA